jgi:hypothetical protein
VLLTQKGVKVCDIYILVQHTFKYNYFFKYEIWACPWLRQPPTCQYGTQTLYVGFVGDKVTTGIGFSMTTWF